MSLDEMEGPCPFTEQSIDAHVRAAIGNYALGCTENRKFEVQYVGRSDTDLNRRLKDHLNEGFREFRFSYAGNIIAAYRNECRYYHQDHPRLNEIHPDRPDGLDSLQCPVCHQ